MKTLSQRFHEKITTGPVHKCWHWAGALTGEGYGNIKVSGKALPAHRISYELHRSPIPEGMHVLHKCDNPACVNPEHLFLGTHDDNMKDMYSKGRRKAVAGFDNGAGKLAPEDIERIIKDKTPSETLGPLLGVSGSRVRQIRRASRQQTFS